MKNGRRIFASLMAVCMVAGMLPVLAFAAECEHHQAHTPECSYAADVENSCTFVCDLCGADGGNGDGGSVAPTCTGDEYCLLSEGHSENCPKASGSEKPLCSCGTETDAHAEGCPLASGGGETLCSCGTETDTHAEGCPLYAIPCDGLDTCPAELHNALCLKGQADRDAAELAKCDQALTCPAALHQEDCAYALELAKCTSLEGCEAAVHNNTCPAYVWSCDLTLDCKADTHGEGCRKAAHEEALDACTHETYGPWDVLSKDCPAGCTEEHAHISDLISFVHTCTFCQHQEENESPEILNTIMAEGDEETARANIAQAVTDGEITQAVADMLLATLTPMTIGYEWFTDATGDVYEISTIEELREFAKLTQGSVAEAGTKDATNFDGKTVNLTANLAFGADDYWYNSEDSTNYIIKNFAGTFNGGNNTISGLKFKNTSATNPSLGLFGTVTGSINDLTVANVTAQTNDRDGFGFIAKTLNGSASNCHVDGVTMSVTGYYTTCGFLFGSVSDATVSGCSVSNVNFKTTGKDNSDNFGGVIGSAKNSTISRCTASNITLTFDQKTKRTGGFVGTSEKNTFTGCTATGVTITVGTYYQNVGGFVGRENGGSAYSGCNVVDYTFSGGCTNYAGEAGGFAAVTNGTVSFTDCHVTDLNMTVACNDSNEWGTGGFISWQSGSVTLNNCSVSGSITATGTSTTQMVGGLVGQAVGTGLTIEDSSAAGVSVSASGPAGGLVGGVSTTTPVEITGSTASSSVGSSSIAGGLVGYAGIGANITFGDNCTPSPSVTGPITNEVVNSADKEYSDTEHYTSCPCYTTVSGYDIGYHSIQAALDAGATNITLLQDLTEDFSLNRSLTLNLDTFILDGTVSFPDNTFTANGKDEHEVCQIDGITLTITGTSTEKKLLLDAPMLDSHSFLGWCGSPTSTPDYAAKSGSNWVAEPGKTYHGHWQHSTYTVQDQQMLHHIFHMPEGGPLPAAHTVTFESTDSNAAVTAVDQGNYFDVNFSGLAVTITPKESVKALTPGSYPQLIHVTVRDGSNHTITATLTVIETFTITFDANGGTLASTTAVTDVDGKLTALPIPVKTGYTFDGWFLDADDANTEVTTATTFTGDTIVHAKWTAADYTITYRLDGGSNPAGAPTTYTVESQTISLPVPDKDFYRFDGWYLEDTFQTKVTQIPTGTTGDQVFYAKWTYGKYTIIQGAAQHVTRGSSVTFVSDAPRDKFVEVQVDGNVLDTSLYTLSGSTTTEITLSGDYTRTLPRGSHTLAILSSDGSATTTFTVRVSSKGTPDSDSPQTGDTTNTGLWYALVMIGLMGLVVSTAGKKYLMKRK